MSSVMTIATMMMTFPDEWLAAEVTAVDLFDVPVAGVVLSHSPEKSVVYRAAHAYREQHPPDGSSCVFPVIPCLPTSE